MSNIRMLMKNLWDDAAVSVTTGALVPTLPLTSSQVYGRSLTAGITPDGTGKSAVQFNLDGFFLVDGLVIYRHWLSSGALWRLELFDGINCAGNKVYDSGEIEAVQTKNLGELMWLADPLVATIFETWPFKFSQLWLAEPLYAHSGRITLIDTLSRDGIHEFDRVYLGHSIQPGVNFNWGAEHAWQSNEQPKRSAGGSVFAAEKQRLRQFSFELAYLVEEERPHVSEGIKHVGLSRDWFISLYPGNGGQKEIEYAMACKFQSLPPLAGSAFNNYQTRISVQEA
ncbi:MAG: hypothetical protein U5L02_16600 [Rheinheimera sp.]|nr:hypothetical protein [Rheinheimera sp.]